MNLREFEQNLINCLGKLPWSYLHTLVKLTEDKYLISLLDNACVIAQKRLDDFFADAPYTEVAALQLIHAIERYKNTAKSDGNEDCVVAADGLRHFLRQHPPIEAKNIHSRVLVKEGWKDGFVLRVTMFSNGDDVLPAQRKLPTFNDRLAALSCVSDYQSHCEFNKPISPMMSPIYAPATTFDQFKRQIMPRKVGGERRDAITLRNCAMAQNLGYKRIIAWPAFQQALFDGVKETQTDGFRRHVTNAVCEAKSNLYRHLVESKSANVRINGKSILEYRQELEACFLFSAGDMPLHAKTMALRDLVTDKKARTLSGADQEMLQALEATSTLNMLASSVFQSFLGVQVTPCILASVPANTHPELESEYDYVSLEDGGIAMITTANYYDPQNPDAGIYRLSQQIDLIGVQKNTADMARLGDGSVILVSAPIEALNNKRYAVRVHPVELTLRSCNPSFALISDAMKASVSSSESLESLAGKAEDVPTVRSPSVSPALSS